MVEASGRELLRGPALRRHRARAGRDVEAGEGRSTGTLTLLVIDFPSGLVIVAMKV